MIDTEDPYGWDSDVVYRDADIQQAQWTAEGNRLQRLRESGVCLHSSAVGLPESGQIFYPEQRSLKPGQQACTEHTGGCNAVFDSFEDWHRAHMAF